MTFKLPTVREPTKDQTRLIRLDPIALFLILYAVFSFLLIIVLTNTPFTVFGPTTDLGSLAANYLLFFAPIAGFAPLLVGNYIYDPRQLGPILRPVTWGRKLRRERFPDVAILGIVASLGLIVVLDYYLQTYGGTLPSLSFWPTLTNKIAFSDGGIFEEFAFRGVLYGVINRFPGLNKYLLQSYVGFFLVTAPLDVAGFVIYHLRAYANSTLSLAMVATEAYIINGTYRVLKYPLWVVMVIHAILNFAAAP